MIGIARPNIGEEEKEAICKVIESGILACGTVVKEFEEKFAAYVGTAHSIATTSGTTALEVALMSLGLNKGDKVLTTAYSFIATANAIIYSGLEPVFVDIEEETFNIDKIIAAISKANKEVATINRMSEEQVNEIAQNVTQICADMNRALNVEEIQDLVENQIMNKRAFAVARKYITYRYTRALVRKSNSTDKQIMSLLECQNEEVLQENSNKNPAVNSVQRDYMAGEVSKDITRRFLLPEDIVRAHEQGIIHFHDSDYFAQHMHNCCLVNLDDMLQNGTVISETMIDTPKSFSTACNIATQSIAQIASSQYGGQSISLAHLAPFVNEIPPPGKGRI